MVDVNVQESSVAQQTLCAATLTYRVAPYPLVDQDDLFVLALLAESDRQTAASLKTSATGRLLSRAWEGAKSFAQESIVGMRQADFLRLFTQHLEANAEEFDVAMVSARCSLLSMGVPVPGLLFVTNWGLYFCSDKAAAAADTAPVPTAAGPASLSLQQPACSETCIKDYIGFARVASILPSVATEEHTASGEAHLRLEGVPSPQVLPSAIQVYTVAPPGNQLYQFVCISDVVARPPAQSQKHPRTSRVRSPEEQPEFVDVLQPAQYPLVNAMPTTHDAFKLASLTWMLWRQRLESAGLPALNPLATFADPH